MKYIALTMFPTHFQLKKSTVPKKMHKIVHQTPWNWTSVSAIYFAPSTVKVSASPALCSHPDSATEKTGFRIVIQYRTATPAHHIPAIASTSGLTSANWIQVVPKATSPTTPTRRTPRARNWMPASVPSAAPRSSSSTNPRAASRSP